MFIRGAILFILCKTHYFPGGDIIYSRTIRSTFDGDNTIFTKKYAVFLGVRYKLYKEIGRIVSGRYPLYLVIRIVIE